MRKNILAKRTTARECERSFWPKSVSRVAQKNVNCAFLLFDFCEKKAAHNPKPYMNTARERERSF
jgi:hypothetical protein